MKRAATLREMIAAKLENNFEELLLEILKAASDSLETFEPFERCCRIAESLVPAIFLSTREVYLQWF